MYNFQCSISFRLCLYTKKISNKKIQIVFHTFLHLVMVVNEYEHHLLKKNNYQTCKVCIHYLYGFRDFLSFNFENWGCLGLLRFMTFPECYHFFSRENLQLMQKTRQAKEKKIFGPKLTGNRNGRIKTV